ncbi:MAG: hypothetical protein H6981_04645 [Gammaproteobacteria bacterium]|nr:hypothetical protein [Gammaproteobacteria bacterium]
MHAAQIMNSKRLQRTARALADGQWHTTWEIASTTRSVAVSTDISELRRNGLVVESRTAGTSEDGGRVYEYRLTNPGILADLLPAEAA